MVGFPTVYDCEVVAVSPNYLEVYERERGVGGRKGEEKKERGGRNTHAILRACMCKRARVVHWAGRDTGHDAERNVALNEAAWQRTPQGSGRDVGSTPSET